MFDDSIEFPAKSVSNMDKCLASQGLCTCETKNAFKDVDHKAESFARSDVYVKVMKYVSKNDIGLTSCERDQFIISSTMVLNFVKAIRNCKSHKESDCLCNN